MALLIGWNVAIIASFLFAILVVIVGANLAPNLSGWPAMVLTVGPAIILGGGVGWLVGRRLLTPLGRVPAPWSYALVGLLVVITLFTFPRPFTYVMLP